MSYFVSIILGSVIWFHSAIAFFPSPSLAALPIIRDIFAGNPPNNIGLTENHLTACPKTPNCVLSQDPDTSHSIDPLTYQSDRAEAYQTLLKVLSVVPNTTIKEETGEYIRAESESRIMGFKDDLEFYLPENEKIIHIRSASRLGESDLGVNRRRMEQIRLALQDLNA
jgi:uncharacterized protein (DUF1499 family)